MRENARKLSENDVCECQWHSIIVSLALENLLLSATSSLLSGPDDASGEGEHPPSIHSKNLFPLSIFQFLSKLTLS